MIPKILHFVWVGPYALPAWAKANMRIFAELNPDYRILLHGDEHLMERFRPAYNTIHGAHEWARKSDLIRVSVLREYGGWYFDTDFLPIRPISELCERYSGFPARCFITHGAYAGKRRWIANGIIGTTQYSPFLSRIIDGISARMRCGDRSWGAFGPALFTRLAEKYPKAVQIGELDDFYRIQDRNASMAAYARIRAMGYSRDAILKELGEPLPFAMHQSMQDEVTL